MIRGVGGGNFLILGRTRAGGARARPSGRPPRCRKMPNVIMPFPGGVVRSGSKIGSKYKGLVASTNDAYCPTLKARRRAGCRRRRRRCSNS